TVSRRRFTKSQSIFTACKAVTFDKSSPSNMGFREAKPANPPEPLVPGFPRAKGEYAPEWHAEHCRLSSRWERKRVSRLLPSCKSTVRTIAGEPAFSARLIMAWPTSHTFV